MYTFFSAPQKLETSPTEAVCLHLRFRETLFNFSLFFKLFPHYFLPGIRASTQPPEYDIGIKQHESREDKDK